MSLLYSRSVLRKRPPPYIRSGNFLVIRICAICFVFPRAAAIIPSVRVPLYTISTSPTNPSGGYPPSWRLAKNSHLKLAQPAFFPSLARMAGGSSTAADTLGEAPDEQLENFAEAQTPVINEQLENFAEAQTPIINPDVTEYHAALEKKAERVRALLGDHLKVPLHVEPSSPLHYRMRAEFRIWHVGEECHFTHFDPQTKKPIFVEQYPLACARINEIMMGLQGAFKDLRDIRHKLFQVEIVASTSGEVLVCLVYRKKLGGAGQDDWMAAAQELAGRLSTPGQQCHIVGRSKGKKLLVGVDHVVQWQEVRGRAYPQWQTENKFSQSNAGICSRMQAWVLDQLQGEGPGGGRASDILELYCGNGNFSLPLASMFRKVLATELDKFSVRAAAACAKELAINNLKFAFLTAAETAEAFDKVRAFQRLIDADIDLDTYDIRTILVDPPRAGLDAASLELTKKYDEIVYISCNPAKLRAELDSFKAAGLSIASAALFDQFPWTEHAEVAVVLRRA